MGWAASAGSTDTMSEFVTPVSNNNYCRVYAVWGEGEQPTPPPSAPPAPAQNGWIQNGEGDWFYFKNGEPYADGWLYSGGVWYYICNDPANDSCELGQMYASCWLHEGSRWYYFGANGKLVKNKWVASGSCWFYVGSNGARRTGWLKSGGSWYYLDPAADPEGLPGAMATGWLALGSARYYLKPSGKMAVGWTQISDEGETRWYYFKSGGAPYNGWLKSGGVWYYIDRGYMLHGDTVYIGSR